MKSRILIATAALVVLTSFNPGKAKAWSIFPIIPIIPIFPVTPTPPKTTPLPIDNGVGILTIAGILMGATIVRKSTPALKAVTVKA